MEHRFRQWHCSLQRGYTGSTQALYRQFTRSRCLLSACILPVYCLYSREGGASAQETIGVAFSNRQISDLKYSDCPIADRRSRISRFQISDRSSEVENQSTQ